ncbi:MAG: hypothetical protein ACKVKV_06750, partial [Dehalococcoidia bacterium]
VENGTISDLQVAPVELAPGAKLQQHRYSVGRDDRRYVSRPRCCGFINRNPSSMAQGVSNHPATPSSPSRDFFD